MAETVIVRGAGGGLFEMDVPTETHALEAWNERLAKGELVIVTEPVEWVEVQGAFKLQVVAPVDDGAEPEPAVEESTESEPEQSRRRGRAAKSDPEPTEE